MLPFATEVVGGERHKSRSLISAPPFACAFREMGVLRSHCGQCRHEGDLPEGAAREGRADGADYRLLSDRESEDRKDKEDLLLRQACKGKGALRIDFKVKSALHQKRRHVNRGSEVNSCLPERGTGGARSTAC